MTVFYSVVFLIVVQMVICTRGQAQTEHVRFAGPSDEGDYLDLQLPPYRKRSPLTDLIENTESAEEGQEDSISSQIMSTDRLLNTVLMQMQRAREEGELTVGNDDIDYGSMPQYPKHRDELGFPEYAPEATWDREERENKKSGFPNYDRLCDVEYESVQIDDFEGIPIRYSETKCKRTEYDTHPTNQMCSTLEFSCVQLNRTINFARRLKGSNKWQHHERNIKSGCECLWPTHKLGNQTQYKDLIAAAG